MLTPNELVLTIGGLHVCVQFGENRRRNATVRVSTDRQTHTRTDAKQFYYLSMLYAIAMGQIKTQIINTKLCKHVCHWLSEISHQCQC